MAHSRSRRILVRRLDDGATRRSPDEVVVEEPLEIRLDGHPVTTTMRTPGHDHELAVGFAHAEGLLDGIRLQGVRSCGLGLDERAAFNIVDLSTGGQAPAPTPRLTTTSSACGVCGSADVDALVARLKPLDRTIEVAPELTVTRGGSALVYYDLEDGRIHVSLPDPTDPLGRLQRFTFEYYRMCQPTTPTDSTTSGKSGRGSGGATVSVMADFAQQLLTQHPKEAALAFVPLVSRYESLLDEAAAAGAIRSGLDHRRITGVVLQAVMFHAFADTISASSVRDDRSAEGLWELLLDGLGTGTRG